MRAGKSYTPPLEQSSILGIVGPTASGKTPVSILLAELLNGEIVSADSRQVYRQLNIGTAKPGPEELERVRHHFINILDITQEYSAGVFGQEARQVIGDIIRRGKLPILVGGSGLYVKAVVDGLFDGPGKDPEVRARIEEQLANEGLQALYERLRRVDPNTAERMKEVKARQVVRALEIYRITGKPISEFHAGHAMKPEFDVVQIGLEWSRKELYTRIEDRVDSMMRDGLVDEVRHLKGKGYERRLNALNSVGYREVFDFLEGLTDEHEMIRLIKQNTRQFAKRQLTWFRSDKRIQWIPMSAPRDLVLVAEKIGDISRQHVSKEVR